MLYQIKLQLKQEYGESFDGLINQEILKILNKQKTSIKVENREQIYDEIEKNILALKNTRSVSKFLPENKVSKIAMGYRSSPEKSSP